MRRARALPNGKRSRVHLITLPADDADVTGHIVNALQTAADVVTQKSKTEGFSLTVAEAMWKRRPVVASGIGGIRELIADERDGLLLGNPDDIARFGQLLSRVLADPISRGAWATRRTPGSRGRSCRTATSWSTRTSCAKSRVAASATTSRRSPRARSHPLHAPAPAGVRR